MASTDVVFQGWLKKKGKKRFFVLRKDHILYWFQKEQKNVNLRHAEIKGCLELAGCVVKMEDKPAFTFTVCNVKEMTYYNLTASDAATARQWVDHVGRGIESANRLKREGGVEEKRGVLTKKGKQRLFVLKGDSLTWFLSGPSEKKAKGSMLLHGARVAPAPRPYTFAITPSIGKRYELSADTQAECDDWIRALERVIDKCAVAVERAENLGKSGWLIKKGKRRWFVCRNGKLLWFDKPPADENAKANGYLLLVDCEVEQMSAQPKSGEYPLQLNKAGVKKAYVLVCPSEQECESWIMTLKRNALMAERTSDLMDYDEDDDATSTASRANSMHTDLVVDSALSSSSSSVGGPPPPLPQRDSSSGPMLPPRPGSMPGIPLPGAHGGPPPVPSRTGSSSATDAAPRGSAQSGSPHTDGEDEDDVPEGPREKSGWLSKKGKRRWFVIDDGTLKWYSSPPKHANVRPNGFLKIDDSLMCALRTPSGGEFPFAAWNPVTDYEIFAASKEDAVDWVNVLRRNGARGERQLKNKDALRASSRREKSGTAPKMETDIDGWLTKKGKKRWFMLTNQRLLWFNTVQVDERTAANGYLDVSECKVRRIPQQIKGHYGFLIYSKLDRKSVYLLLCADSAEMERWVKVLLEKGGAEFDADTAPTLRSAKADGAPVPGGKSGKGGKDAHEEGKVFRMPLADHLRATGREGGVPMLVERCIAFIEEHGMDQEGIFRVSGDADNVAALRQAFDRGDDVHFSASEDVHAVSGVLKLYLREMPDPLLTFGLYDAFMAVHHEDTDGIKALLEKLPSEHLDLFRYLFAFLVRVTEHQDVNLMKSQNVAIVVAPNILKAREATMAMLANTGQVNAIVKAMIDHFDTICP